MGDQTIGSKQEISEIWLDLEAQLRARLCKLIGPSPDLEDLLQDVFVKVYRNAESVDLQSARQYMMRATTNRARDYIRQQGKRQFTTDHEIICYETPVDHYQETERLATCERVRAEIEKLEPRLKEAMYAAQRFETTAEAAFALGVKPTTLWSRQRRAMCLLRRKLPSPLFGEKF